MRRYIVDIKGHPVLVERKSRGRKAKGDDILIAVDFSTASAGRPKVAKPPKRRKVQGDLPGVHAFFSGINK